MSKAKRIKRRVNTNSLNHNLKSSAAMIDDLLAEQNYTIKEIAAMCETTEARVRSHISHLRNVLNCTVKIDSNKIARLTAYKAAVKRIK